MPTLQPTLQVEIEVLSHASILYIQTDAICGLLK